MKYRPAIDNVVTSTASEESCKRKSPHTLTVPTIQQPNGNKPPTPPIVPRTNGKKAPDPPTGPTAYKICNREPNIKNIIKLLITGLHPISFLEDAPFRDFCQAIIPDYSLPSTDKVFQMIKRMYDSERANLMKELTATSFVSLSMESWKSNSGHIYTTIRGHFVDSSWELKSHVISSKLPDLATSNFELNDISQSWGIQDKVHTVTSELKAKHNFPAIPSLSLLPGYVTIALNESSNVNKILEKARSIFEYFGKLANEKVCLDDSRHQFFPEFFLLDSILQKKAAIQEMLVGTAAMDLTKDEWSLLDKVVDTLKPFDLIKQLICGEAKEGEASLIKPLIHTLCENFLCISHTEDQSIKTLKINI